MNGYGKKQNSDNNQKGLPKFVRENRNKQAREEERVNKLNKTSGKSTNKDGNKGKR